MRSAAFLGAWKLVEGDADPGPEGAERGTLEARSSRGQSPRGPRRLGLEHPHLTGMETTGPYTGGQGGHGPLPKSEVPICTYKGDPYDFRGILRYRALPPTRRRKLGLGPLPSLNLVRGPESELLLSSGQAEWAEKAPFLDCSTL